MNNVTRIATMLGALSPGLMIACNKAERAATEVPASPGTDPSTSESGECLHSEGCCGGHTEGDGSCGAGKAEEMATRKPETADEPANAQKFEWTVEPGKFAEINVELDAGTEMTASFEADGELAWNVHSHEGKKPTIHAEGKEPKSAPAFVAEKAGMYSYLWVNKSGQAVKLTVDLRFNGNGRVHSTHPEVAP
jgi:hypothetical protein